MIFCPACGTQNEDSARFCSECGSVLLRPVPLPADPVLPVREPGYEHDFTHGVMRYVPDQAQEEAAPVYLTSQAAQTLQEPVQPAGQRAPAVPEASTVPVSGAREGTPPASGTKRRQKKNSHAAAIVVMSLIGILLILIVVGIAVLLGG